MQFYIFIQFCVQLLHCSVPLNSYGLQQSRDKISNVNSKNVINNVVVSCNYYKYAKSVTLLCITLKVCNLLNKSRACNIGSLLF